MTSIEASLYSKSAQRDRRPKAIAWSVERTALVLTAIAALITWRIGSTSMLRGVLCGGVLATANLYALRRLLSAVTSDVQGARVGQTVVLLIIKFMVFGGLLAFASIFLGIDPAGLLVGFTTAMISLFFQGLRVARHGLAVQKKHSGASRVARDP